MSYFNFSSLANTVYSCIKQETKIFPTDKSRTKASFVNALFYDEDKFLAQSTVSPWFNGDTPVSKKYVDLVNAEPDWLCGNIEEFVIPALVEPYVCSDRIWNLILSDSTITAVEKENLSSHYPCKNENDTADFLRDCFLFAINRPIEITSAIPVKSFEIADDFSEYICPSPCKYFVGRNSEISEIHHKLQLENHVVINGIAGIGKTEILRKYAEVYKSEYEHILYFYCNSDLKTEIAEMYFSDDTASGIDELYRQHLRKLRGMKNTLIIVDNLNSEDDTVQDLFKLRCHVIIAVRANSNKYYEVNELSEGELFSMFSAIYSETDKYAEIVRNIIRILNCHTYSAELAARLLEHTLLKPDEILKQLKGKLSIKGIADRFKTHKTNKRDTFYQHLETMFNLYELSADKEYIMMCLAFIENSKIPVKDFAVIIGLENTNSIEDLEELGLLKISDNKLEIHAVIRDFILMKTEPEIYKLENLINNLTAIFRRNDIFFSGIYHAITISLNLIEHFNDSSRIFTTFLFNFFDACEMYKDYQAVERCYSVLKKQKFTHNETAHFLDCSACMCAINGDYKSAVEFSAKAVNTINPDEDYLLTANIHANLGYYYHLDNQLESAEKSMQKAMEYFSRIPADETIYFDKYRFIQNYCNLLGSKGEHLKAIDLLKKLQIEVDSKLGSENMITADILFDTGVLYLCIDETENAENNITTAFRMFKRLNADQRFLSDKISEIRQYSNSLISDSFTDKLLICE